MSTSQLDKITADRVLIEAARGLITYQTLSRLMEMIHIMLYEEEVSGAPWPDTRPARCHVTYHVHVADLKVVISTTRILLECVRNLGNVA